MKDSHLHKEVECNILKRRQIFLKEILEDCDLLKKKLYKEKCETGIALRAVEREIEQLEQEIEGVVR